MQQVKNRFAIEIEDVEFIPLQTADTMHPNLYPRFTLGWQMVAFVRVALEAFQLYPCDVFVDTVGVGCSYAALKILFGCKIVSYTHYPMISSDMLKQIGSGSSFNNAEAIENSWLYRSIKRLYYHVLMFTYRFCGRFAD